jgi:hypothetical protein
MQTDVQIARTFDFAGVAEESRFALGAPAAATLTGVGATRLLLPALACLSAGALKRACRMHLGLDLPILAQIWQAPSKIGNYLVYTQYIC